MSRGLADHRRPGVREVPVAQLLADRSDRSVHVRGGQFYRWAVHGWLHFDGDDRYEARRLLELRYRLSALAATNMPPPGSLPWPKTTSTDPTS